MDLPGGGRTASSCLSSLSMIDEPAPDHLPPLLLYAPLHFLRIFFRVVHELTRNGLEAVPGCTWVGSG